MFSYGVISGDGGDSDAGLGVVGVIGDIVNGVRVLSKLWSLSLYPLSSVLISMWFIIGVVIVGVELRVNVAVAAVVVVIGVIHLSCTGCRCVGGFDLLNFVRCFNICVTLSWRLLSFVLFMSFVWFLFTY